MYPCLLSSLLLKISWRYKTLLRWVFVCVGVCLWDQCLCLKAIHYINCIWAVMGALNKSLLKFNPVIKGEAKPGMLFLISLTMYLFLSFVDSQWTAFILNYQFKCTSCSLCRASYITSSFGFLVVCSMFTGFFLQLHWNNPSIIQWLSSFCSVSLSLSSYKLCLQSFLPHEHQEHLLLNEALSSH